MKERCADHIRGKTICTWAIFLLGQTEKAEVIFYGNMGGKLLPIRLAGDGMNRLLIIMLSIMENPNSIFLVDEIENGFHYLCLPQFHQVLPQSDRSPYRKVPFA